MNMFTLDKDQQKAFLTSLYSIIMFDKVIGPYENKILESIRAEVFGLDEYLKLDLESPEKIAETLLQIGSETYTRFLFELAKELSEYVSKEKRKLYGPFLAQIEDFLTTKKAGETHEKKRESEVARQEKPQNQKDTEPSEPETSVLKKASKVLINLFQK